MDEQKRNNDIEEAASALIKNAEADSVSLGEKREQKNGNGGNAGKAPEKAPGKEGKFFKKYKIKDIVDFRDRATVPRPSVFDFSRDRHDESEKTGRAVFAVGVYGGISRDDESADGDDRALRIGCRGGGDADLSRL